MPATRCPRNVQQRRLCVCKPNRLSSATQILTGLFLGRGQLFQSFFQSDSKGGYGQRVHYIGYVAGARNPQRSTRFFPATDRVTWPPA